jgi:hypothetical protein
MHEDPLHEDPPFTRLAALSIATGILVGYLIASKLF